MESALVSIIVPVYNVAAYLDRCVDSILHQTYPMLEVLLVDDGSTDGSGEMCDTWCKRDTRIHVIHKPNGGLSSARNAALDMMTGSVVAFVDSDDSIEPQFVERLMQTMRDNDADIAVAAWEITDNPTVPADDGASGASVFTSSEAIDEVFYQGRLTNSACSRLIKASLFDGLRFPEGMLYEDLAIAYDLLKRVLRVAYIDTVLYHYLQRPGSITTTFTPDRTHVLDICENLEKKVSTEAPQHLPAVRSRLLSASFNILLLCPANRSMNDVEQRCWSNISRLRSRCLTDRRVRAKNKAGILLSYLGRRALCLFRRTTL